MKSMLFFLRAASLLDGLLLSYPLLAILEVSLTGRLSAPLSLPRLGIVLLSGALGAFIGWLLDRMKNPPVRAITLLLAAAPAAGLLQAVGICGKKIFFIWRWLSFAWCFM